MKPKIAFLTGGYSGEAEISYQSAKTIEQHIDKSKFDFFKIDITPRGWLYQDTEGQRQQVDKNDFSITIGGRKIQFDAAFIGIHGTPGEDGKLQGYLDMAGIPYTTCDAATSAITFNKRYTVAVAGMEGINVARSLLLFSTDKNAEQIIKDRLQFPVFIKPNNGGSSIGMSKVDQYSEALGAALARAFREDHQVLVEEFIEGREFTVGVYKAGKEITVLPITEVTTGNAFFDFDAKYRGASKEITPADIDEEVADTIRETAAKIYRVFNCRGVIRIDFIYNAAKRKLYMLEVNTVPGQTEASIVPMQIKAMGGKLSDLYTMLLEQCLESTKS